MADLVLTTDLVCPECEHREWVSPEDPDASQSEMLRHLRRKHPAYDAFELLHRVREVRRRADA